MLVWIIAIPDGVIRRQIEDAVARAGNKSLNLQVDGFKKGVFFSLHADSLNLSIDGRPALKITDFTGSYSPRYLASGQLAVTIRGKIGTGKVSGTVKLPLEGKIIIDRAELSSVPYLTQFNININGSLSSEINIIHDVVKMNIDVPDLNIDDRDSVIPLLNTFRRMQGAISIKGNSIRFDSISLEGEKGYARLKGNITNNVMDLYLELMPIAGTLNTMESMLIGKYIVSPGYYVVPIRGAVR